jgi:hypothetical protein
LSTAFSRRSIESPNSPCLNDLQLELEPLPHRLLGQMRRLTESSLVPVDRLVVEAEVAGQRGLLEQKLDRLRRAFRPMQARRLERLSRRLELAGELPAVAEGFPGFRNLRLCQLGNARSDVERPLVELCGLEVGPLRLRPSPGLERVAPRRGPVARPVVVE